jgi:Cu(I)/Ag(I) efflux system protein CusF
MKLLLTTATLALAISVPALAQPSGDIKAMPGMSSMQGMDQSPMTTADGAGVVKGVDPKVGTVTIQHGPIAALNWPAMTMTFKARPPSLLHGITVGQSVKFKLMKMGGSTALTAIQAN